MYYITHIKINNSKKRAYGKVIGSLNDNNVVYFRLLETGEVYIVSESEIFKDDAIEKLNFFNTVTNSFKIFIKSIEKYF